MPSLQIDDPRAAELANQLAAVTGETVVEAVVRSLERRLSEYGHTKVDHALFDDLMKLTETPLTVADNRSEAEILGYNESGVF